MSKDDQPDPHALPGHPAHGGDGAAAKAVKLIEELGDDAVLDL
jgi:hypothetical protein